MEYRLLYVPSKAITGGVASVVCATACKLALWSSRKVMQIAHAKNDDSWKKTALKIASELLFALAVVTACASIAAVTFSMTVCACSMGALAILPGLISGAITAGFFTKQFREYLYPPPDDMEIEFEWRDAGRRMKAEG